MLTTAGLLWTSCLFAKVSAENVEVLQCSVWWGSCESGLSSAMQAVAYISLKKKKKKLIHQNTAYCSCWEEKIAWTCTSISCFNPHVCAIQVVYSAFRVTFITIGLDFTKLPFCTLQLVSWTIFFLTFLLIFFLLMSVKRYENCRVRCVFKTVKGLFCGKLENLFGKISVKI